MVFEVSAKELKALDRYLHLMQGFGESVIYENYLNYENMTDKEYGEIVETLVRLILRTEKYPRKSL